MAAPRLLVTGGSGFVGRACLAVLAAEGYDLHVAVRRPERDAAGTWHACDLLDAAAGEALLAHLRPTHLLHLAWIAQPGVFWSSPLNRDWLEASRRLVSRFYAQGGMRAVGLGSCAEYGASEVPASERATPIAPGTPYGEAKATMSQVLRRAAGKRGWAWARLFFPYGPGEAPGRFIPSVIDGLMAGKPVDCTHGRQVRDFVYVEDVASALATLVESDACGTFNVGSGEALSLRQVAQEIATQLGGAALLRFGARPVPAHEPPFLVADTAALRAATGWAPRIGLPEGIRRTIAARRSPSRPALP